MIAAFLLRVGYPHWALTALLLIPLAGALVIPALPAAMAKRVALVVTLVEFVVSAGMWWAYLPEGAPFQRSWMTAAPPRRSASTGEASSTIA